MRDSLCRRLSVFLSSAALAMSASLFASAIGSRPLFGQESPPQNKKPAAEAPAVDPSNIAPPTEADLATARIQFMSTALGRYTVVVPGVDAPLASSAPCLRWNNPVSGTSDGILAIFGETGRPAVIAQFFKTKGGSWVHEFAVTGTDEIEILRSGKLYWKPSEFVFAFQDVPDAPEPAKTPALRLPQMRRIAERFSVTDHHGFQESQITPTRLRLLTTPLHRYEKPGEILDGALFSFVMGTDPECNLLIEAQPPTGKDGPPRYRYAFAPMSIYQLDAELDDKPVWTIERRIIFGQNCEKYYALTYRPEPGEKLP